MDVTLNQCEQFIKDYFDSYAGVRRFLDRVVKAVQERGYVKSLLGRRRRLAGRTPREQRQAQNFVIQASAADIAKDAMVRLHQNLPEGAHLIAQIHDEFIVECREKDAEGVRSLMIEVMTQAPDKFSIPLKVDAHVCDNWGEAK